MSNNRISNHVEGNNFHYGLGFTVWEQDFLRVYEVVRYVCLTFDSAPPDNVLMQLEQSPFMYGYLKGGACWHALASPETRKLAIQIASGERRAVDRSVCGLGGCDLRRGHKAEHRGACGCLLGCTAEGCPNKRGV